MSYLRHGRAAPGAKKLEQMVLLFLSAPTLAVLHGRQEGGDLAAGRDRLPESCDPASIRTSSSRSSPLRSSADATRGEWHYSIIAQLTSTSALLADPRSNEAEKHTSDDDGDGESDETEP